MNRVPLSRIAVIGTFLLGVALLGAGVWRYGYVTALGQLADTGRANLTLASDRVTSQLQRYRELSVLMSDHPEVARLARGGAPDAVGALFQDVADKTAALEIFYVTAAGDVRASAHGRVTGNVGPTDYLQRALTGALGAGHAAQGVLGERAYYYAAPYFDADARVLGAVVVAVNVGELEWNWTGSNPAVFFTDANGLVFMSNRSELVYWRRDEGQSGLAPPKGPALPFEATREGGHTVWELDWGPYLPRHALHIVRSLPVIDLTAEALLDTSPASRIAWLQAGAFVALCLAFGAILLVVTERRRTLAQLNAVLEARVAKRTRALSTTNARLRDEIREREEAETRLRKAQQELVQAGKLSALGQMSAGISHELNQPLMAIQSFADNAGAYLDRGNTEKVRENLGRVADLAHRMGRIIRNLRAFARQEGTQTGRVDLASILASAIELTAARLAREQVVLDYTPPAGPVWVRGGEVRLAQVFVNLLTNAADAMAGTGGGRIVMDVSAEPIPTVTVRDSGPGIAAPDKVFEPFYSTKQVETGQEGLGLGLSISYGIVQSVGGDIVGRNHAAGGAEFVVTLEPWHGAERAA